jgi:hypothetical protein
MLVIEALPMGKLFKVFHILKADLQLSSINFLNEIATLLTRNVKDFRKADISVMTAEQYVKSME